MSDTDKNEENDINLSGVTTITFEMIQRAKEKAMKRGTIAPLDFVLPEKLKKLLDE